MAYPTGFVGPVPNQANQTPIRPPVNDLSQNYGNVNGTIYYKPTNTAFSNQQDFFTHSGVNSFNNLKFDTAYTPQANSQIYGQTSPARPAGLSFDEAQTSQTSNPPSYDSQGMVSSTYNPTTDPTAKGDSSQYPTPDTTPARPPTDYEKALTDYTSTVAPSAEELAAQESLRNLNATVTGKQNEIQLQGIAQPFKDLQDTDTLRKADMTAAPLNAQLANIQARRQAAMDVAKAKLDIYSPKEVGLGGTLVQRNSTGAYDTVAQGQSYAAKQGSQAVLDLIKTYSDAGILPTDTPQVAAAKASNSASFQIKNSGQSIYVDPNTGQVVYYQNRGPNVAGNAGFQTTPIPTSSSASSSSAGSYTLASDGRTVLANGTPVDLQTFKQMTGQTGKADNQVDFSMVQGNKVAPKTSSSSSSVGSSGRTSAPTISSNAYNPSSDIDNLALSYIQTGTNDAKFPAGKLGKSAVIRRAQELAPGFNPEVAKANGPAVAAAVKKQAAITAAHQKLIGDLQAISSIADQVNKIGAPKLDQFINGLTNEYSNNPTLVQFKHLVTSARGDYAVINSGGNSTPDQGDQTRASGAIPSNGNSAVYNALIQTANGEAQRQIEAQQGVIKQYSTPGQTGTQTLNASGTTLMTGPDGKQYNVPNDKVEAFKASGGH